ncbi:integrator complex subunit 7-like [Saccoglossus kowalevskii]|uniref:Integrator complex subunit 7 n=1 Tax=Saccoglossus kowalevskii TaxID=10224 RepID=A0ABM0MFP2_SACKO|nr:PREDICTED: integrator complex subunit 7-like [Saccoglossus kowalevskii]
MATVSARLTMMGMESSYGEPEQDANTALMELDKGLRSTKLGEQCEAIVRFPRLFEKYPFPILINSAFLKLSEVFRLGSNFLRLCVLKVVQQSQKQLDKILNKDEFLRRIFTVIHSNDPVARAITLRVLGSVAVIIQERKNVHYSIRNSLDSHDAVELEAAIFAATRFAAESRDFAVGICNKVADMIQGLATPVEMKLKLILIFEHMHHDAESAAKVRHLCIRMLPSYPGKAFVITTLHSLSKLAAASLMDIPAQVSLLLCYLDTDPRRVIKTLALQDLRMLAKEAPHMWTSENIELLCQFTSTTPYDGLKIGGFSVLSTLSKSVAFATLNLQAGSLVTELCTNFSYHSNATVSAFAVDVMTNIVISKISLGKDVTKSSEEVAMAMEALIIGCACSGSKKVSSALKTVLCCVSVLCKACPSVASDLVEGITTTLTTTTGLAAILLCQSLAAVGMHQPSVLTNLTSDIKDMFMSISQNIDNKEQEELMVASEHLFFWLNSLQSFCEGEDCLRHLHSKKSNIIYQVQESVVHYERGIATLKAAVTPPYPLDFQCRYVKLRTQMLTLHCQLLLGCQTIKTCPPPAIASTVALATGQDLQNCGRLASQMQQCYISFQSLANQFGDLLQSTFDADPATLENIESIQQSCLLMSHAIDALVLSNRMYNGKASSQVDLFSLDTSFRHGNQLSIACQDAMRNIHEVLLQVEGAAITQLHTECLWKTSVTLLKVPLGFPRYFFQSLQSTSIKLAVSPTPRNPGDPVPVQNDTHLALKIEGVVQHGSRPV